MHVWAFVCIGSTVTTLRPDFRAPVARRVVGLRSQFRVEALVWPLSEGIRTRHCHLRHRVSPTEPGDRCESASLDIQKTGGATMCPPSILPDVRVADSNRRSCKMRTKRSLMAIALGAPLVSQGATSSAAATSSGMTDSKMHSARPSASAGAAVHSRERGPEVAQQRPSTGNVGV